MMKTLQQLLHTLSHTKIEGRIAASIFVLLISSIFPAHGISAQTITAKGQTNDRQNIAPGKSILRGRVVYEDTGRPLSRAQVSLFDLNVPERHYKVTTNERGEFSLGNVIAGTYGIEVNAPGIVNPWRNSSLDRETDSRTVSVDGINPVEVLVRAQRGGIISGRVLQANGEPAVGAIVSILKEKDGLMIPYHVINEGRPQIRTDEHGLYRIGSLSSGKYFVSAAEDNSQVVAQKGEAGSRRVSHGAVKGTFYQATTNLRDAMPVQVEAGSESGNINITLIERSTHAVSGKVVGSDGRAVGRAAITIRNRDESGRLATGRQSAMVDAQGNWSFDSVPDGAYILTFSPAVGTAPYPEDEKGHRAGSGGRPLPDFTLRHQAVTVAGADVTGIVIEVYRGVRISGRVTVDGGGPPKSAVYVYNLSDMFVPARVEPDGTFKLNDIPPGNVYLDAYPEMEGEYYTKRMSANGVDLMREPLRAEEGTEIKDVSIVISPEVATLKGRVFSTTQGRAPLGVVSVLLVPTDPARQRIPTSRILGRTNDEGAFKVSGAPGEYLVMTWKRGDPPVNEEFIKARATTAQRVRLGPHESKSLDITMPEGK